MDFINDLYEIYETLGKSLKKANDKIHEAGGDLTTSDMSYVNQLTHALKSVKTTIAMIEAEDSGSSYRRDGYDGGSYDGGTYDRGSYARGRGRNAKRDSMGRYSSRGYSRDYHGDMVDELRDLMEQTPDEHTRQEMHRLISKMEQR